MDGIMMFQGRITTGEKSRCGSPTAAQADSELFRPNTRLPQSRRFWLSILPFFLALMASGLQAGATKAGLEWPDSKFTYYSNQLPLSSVLLDIASAARLPLKVEGTIDQKVSFRLRAMTLPDMLTQLAETYRLSWYFDGNMVYVEPLSAIKSKTLTLKSLSPEILKRHLIRLGVMSRDNPFIKWNAIEAKRTIYVAGPSMFLTHVEKFAAEMDGTSAASIVFSWVDHKGARHYTNDYATAPEDAEIIELKKTASAMDQQPRVKGYIR